HMHRVKHLALGIQQFYAMPPGPWGPRHFAAAPHFAAVDAPGYVLCHGGRHILCTQGAALMVRRYVGIDSENGTISRRGNTRGLLVVWHEVLRQLDAPQNGIACKGLRPRRLKVVLEYHLHLRHLRGPGRMHAWPVAMQIRHDIMPHRSGTRDARYIAHAVASAVPHPDSHGVIL